MENNNIFEQFVDLFSQLFSIVGAVLIVYGGSKSIVHMFLLEFLKNLYDYNQCPFSC